MTRWPAHENAPAAGSRGCNHRSDEGSANNPTTHKMTEEIAMPTVETPETFRDLLASLAPEAADLHDSELAKIEACVPWRDISAESTRSLVLQLLDAVLEERDVADQTAHLPVPVWATRKPENFYRDQDGTLRRFHDISTADVPTTGTGFSNGSVGVVTTGIETVGHPDEFTVLVMSDGAEYLTPGEARALAGNLLVAADEADAVALAQ